MITASIEEAGARLNEFLKAVEESGETIVIFRRGKAVAEIKAPSRPQVDRLRPNADLKPLWVAPDIDPTASATNEEWPEEFR